MRTPEIEAALKWADGDYSIYTKASAMVKILASEVRRLASVHDVCHSEHERCANECAAARRVADMERGKREKAENDLERSKNWAEIQALEEKLSKPCEYGHLQAKAEKERDLALAQLGEARDSFLRELQDKMVWSWTDERLRTWILHERTALSRTPANEPKE